MLKVTEFDELEVLRNSDGLILHQYTKETYVILWDDNEVTDEQINNYINQRSEWIKVYGHSTPFNKFIVMTRREWLKLSDMIKNNYELVERKLNND